MQAQLVKRASLPQLPSASALEVSANVLIIVGDDSPDLFFVNQHGRRIGKVGLFNPERLENGRIPKKVKLDLETTLIVTHANHSQLFIMGSGSKGHRRDHGFCVTLPWGTKTTNVTAEMLEGVEVEKFSLKPLYDALREREELRRFARKSSVLNLEGSAATFRHVIFLHRDKLGEGNSIVVLDREEFLTWAGGAGESLPKAAIYPCRLPQIAGAPSGFSGAWFVARDSAGVEELLFSASSEAGEDPVEDGSAAGSALGVLQLPAAYSVTEDAPQLVSWAPITEQGQVFRAKVESVAAFRPAEGGRPKEVFAVTDDDQGGSELLRLRVDWG